MGALMEGEEQPIVQVDAPTSEAEGEALETQAEEATEQVELVTDAQVEIERLRQEGETQRCAIEAEASVQREEAYAEARIAEAEAQEDGVKDEWRQSIEASLATLTAAVEALSTATVAQVEQSIPQSSTPAEQPDPMPSQESAEVALPEAAAEPVEPPKKVKKLRWI